MNYSDIVTSILSVAWICERIYYYKFSSKDDNNKLDNNAIYNPVIIPPMNSTTVESFNIENSDTRTPEIITIPEANYLLPDNSTNI